MQEQLRIQQNFRFRRVYEDQREIFSPYHQKKERESRINNHHQSTSLDSQPNTFRFTRSVILSAICSHRNAQALKRTDKEHLDAHSRRKGCHTRRSQGIIRTLKHDAADSRDRKLQSHRHTDVEQRLSQFRLEPAFFRSTLQYFKLPVHINVAENSRQSLRKDSSNSSSRHSPAKYQNTEQIKNDIQNSRKQQKPKRRLTVSQRTDNARKKIIEESTRHTNKRDKQISIRPFENILRRTHDPKNILT